MPRALQARNMTSFYIDWPTDAQPVENPKWLLIAYCHARTAGLPAMPVRDFCSRHLHLVPLGPRLTTEAVIRTYIMAPPGDRN